MGRKRRGRPISGILLLNKPVGRSSNHVLQQVKRCFNAQKAGHTGILDPMASGVLPVCLGEATKFSQYLLDADKAYTATVRFGEKTDTADAEGEIIERMACDAIKEIELQAAMTQLLGKQKQVPPMYSALKKDGQPLYKLARQGIEVERKARDIEILSLELLEFRTQPVVEADIQVSCTKGTYIRTLAEDIAKNLGNIAHLVKLERIETSGFLLENCYTLEELEGFREEENFSALDSLLLSPEVAVNHLPSLEISEESGYYLALGQSVFAFSKEKVGDLVRVRDTSGAFLGIAEILDDGQIQPRRLIATAQ